MTTRCAVFAEEQSADQDHDLTQHAFWLTLAENFKRTRRMLEAMAVEMGIELDPAETAKIKKEQEAKRGEIRREPLVILAGRYLKEARALLSSNKYSENDLDEIDEDMLSIVHWYLFFISVKIQRGGFIPSKTLKRKIGKAISTAP